jgi:uridine phosphorylase
MQFPPSELVLNDKNQVYHLGLSPENISDKIILVGDQDRVSMISDFFNHIEHRSQHREFVCHTGIFMSKRITVLSTGIGTDNIDITMNELDALVNIDLINRKENTNKKKLSIIRIGTCGILQPDIPVHSYILSTYAFGLDNVAHFYNIPYSDNELHLCKQIKNHLQFSENIQPYLSGSSVSLSEKLYSDRIFKGITVTSSGFYGPQGRQLRIPNSTVGMNEKLTSFRSGEHRITNFEMESSAIFVLGKALGHDCATICLGVANRPKLEFSKGFDVEMKSLIEYVLERI